MMKPKPALRQDLSILEEDPVTFAGAWMSLIHEIITKQGAALAAEHGAATPARCFSVFLAIARNDPVSIADLARWHGFSHQLMRTRLAELERTGLIKAAASKDDGRKVVLRLTAAGRADLAKVEGACAQARIGLKRIFVEAGFDPAALPRVADALSRERFWKRRD